MRRTLAALATVLVASLCPTGVAGAVASTPTRLAAGHDGPCTDNVGVTIVVDFQDLGGGVNVRCAPTAPRSGFEALQLAGVSYQTATRAPGFLCRIAGKPASDPCVVAAPASAYWGYWIAPRGGDWCFSNLGAGNRTPPPGTIEGWSFSLGRTASQVPAPRYRPPGVIAGTTPNPIPASHCTTPRGVPPTTTPPPVTQPPATTPPVTQAPPVQPPATTPGTPPRPGDGDANPGLPGRDEPDGGGAPAADDDKSADPGDDTTGPEGNGAGIGDDGVDGGGRDGGPSGGSGDDPDGEGDGASPELGPGEAAGASADGPVGTVDLTTDGRDDGSPTGVLVTVAVLAAVGGAGFWRHRSRRSHPAT